MAGKLDRAVARFIASCPHALAVRDLVTKQRIELSGGYVLDLYFNETRGKYSYALVLAGQRVLCWDNAPHHPSLPNFPHHVHREDGTIEASSLIGDPVSDIDIVVAAVNALLAQRPPAP